MCIRDRVQWQMRGYRTIDDLFEQIEFFVDAVSGYKSDFILFPEYFNAPLMAEFNLSLIHIS